ncbi:MAG TPA: MFS transporter [Steroidobacteraceae bacterium]|jgi:SHS family lactate transporter-like MFS transporter
MSLLPALAALNTQQRHTVLASFLGWTLDAFDFFLLTFAITAIAADFKVGREQVFVAVTFTLAARPLGAFVFGRLAERFGRRPILMLDVALFSAFEFATAFSPNLSTLILLRFFFGFAMGGEWGIGASLALEAIPPAARGFISGLLQEGYATGALLAGLVFGLFFDHIGWRGLFMIGALPALLVIYVRAKVPESSVWEQRRSAPQEERSILAAMRGFWGRALYLVLLMTLFNCFSHASQDVFPTFLKVQRGLDAHQTSVVTTIMGVGAVAGGLFFGTLSSRLGRRRAIITAALLSLVMIYPWAYSTTVATLALGAFLMQFMVQGAWGIVPVHLNELSPNAVRAILPGLVYQTGNFISALTPTLVSRWAEANHKNYALTMAIVIACTAVLLAVVTALGPEAKDKHFG